MEPYKLTGLIDWLVGDEFRKPNYEGFITNTPKLKVLNSPFSYYLNQVNRFLFSGGVHVQPDDSDELHNTYIELFNKQNKLSLKLTKIFKRVAITGEVALVHWLNEAGTSFNLAIYEKPEYTIKDGVLTAVTLVKKDGKDYIKRLDASSENVIIYPLVEKEKYETTKWELLGKKVNAYDLPSYTLLMAEPDLETSRGCSLFSFAAVQMALMQLALALDVSENIHFFGQPKYASTMPEDTLKRIKERVQVLQKEGDTQGNSIDILNPPSIDGTAIEWINSYDNKILRALGINPRTDTDINGEVSSLTLRLMYQETIDTAETIWDVLVNNGLEDFYYNLHQSAKAARILNSGEGYVTIARNKPYFYKSPTEVTQELNNGLILIEQGANALEVFKDIYSDKPGFIDLIFGDVLTNGM